MSDFLMDTIELAINHSTSTKVTKEPTKSLCPWLSTEVEKLKKKRKRLLKSYRKNRNNEQLRSDLLKLNDTITTKASRDRAGYLWKNLNSLLGRNKSDNSIEKLCSEAMQVITDPFLMANKLNNEWLDECNRLTDVSLKRRSTAPPTVNKKVSLQLQSIYLSPVTELEMVNLIKSFKPKTTKSLDGLSMYIIKRLQHSIVTLLTILVNKCFVSGKFFS